MGRAGNCLRQRNSIGRRRTCDKPGRCEALAATKGDTISRPHLLHSCAGARACERARERVAGAMKPSAPPAYRRTWSFAPGFVAYLEWGSQIAKEKSTPSHTVAPNAGPGWCLGL